MARPRKVDRKDRVPFGTMKSKLAMDAETTKRYADAGKVLRWINDVDGGTRVKQAQAGGYDFCTSDGSDVAGTDTIDEGNMIRKHVGSDAKGAPQYAYLMAIDKEFYQEDQAAKEAVNKKVDDAIRGGKLPGGGTEDIYQNGVLQGKSNIKQVDYKP